MVLSGMVHRTKVKLQILNKEMVIGHRKNFTCDLSNEFHNYNHT